MKPYLFFTFFLVTHCFISGHTQDSSRKDELESAGIIRRQYHTKPVKDQVIRMDGIHDEAAWSAVEWTSDFTQYEPHDGGIPYQQTQFKIIHDDNNLYLAYRAFDIAPDSIESRLSRRDEFAGDWVEVNIDSYHDLRTAFSFTLSVSGVKGDEFVSDNGNHWDTNWNPIWDGATHIDSLGWTGEVRIPFSQLRYGNQTNPVWGIQVQRRIFRKEERSTWQTIPRNGSGWVSRFGELHGLTNLPTKKQIELAPYISAQTERFEAEAGNPFADGSRSKISGGLDGKLAVTRDLILDFTINPDFGQVEADPGAVRLDGYEIFFGERRPFFMESRNLFDYQLTGSYAGGEYDSDLLFYSRRIGGNPHQYPSLSDGEFAEVPSFASITGAAKFSGKTKNGLSIGILESITDREMATITNGSEERKEIVEPLTSYFAGRVLKDFNDGNTILGGMITSVNRGSGVEAIAKDAYSGGVDFQHYWKNRWWSFKANINFSHLSGSKEAILNTQTGFVHLLQRSDAKHLGVDTDRTSLTGTGGTIKLGKYGGKPDKRGGYYRFETGVTWRSPHLELNDIGFLQAADEINHFGWGAYNLQQPFSIFRSANINYNQYGKWDFGGRLLYAAFNSNINFHFKGNWRTGIGFTWNPYDVSNNALRGNTSLRKPPGFGVDGYFESDSRKKVYASGNINGGHAYQKTVTFFSVSGGLVFQPFNALRFSFSPGYGKTTRKQDQFVSNVSFGNQTRSIVSHVNSRNFSLSTRVNYYITPELSIQYYGQPFIFRALYKNYGYVKDPLNKKYDDRFHPFTSEEITIDGRTASVDENADGQTDYTFSTPDLNYVQFRSNLVVRWEYIAGSEIFLVWSQGVTPDAYGDLSTPLLESLYDHVFDQQPHNIFLVKLSYRFLN
jgi:Domain of unknown function (DUF5916)/Carbohydrate family 9 binding domain-like